MSRERVFAERRNYTTQSCMKLGMISSRNASLLPRLRVAEEHNVLYCGIPKTGSTFWANTLTIIENRQTFSSLYEYRNSKEYWQNGGKTLKKINEVRSEMNSTYFQSFVNHAMSFMFVREPYSRIFSAYNNKILNPNILFWSYIGRNVVRQVREHPSADSLQYGHDVTFVEMIKYLLYLHEHSKPIDQHFAPMNKKCNPCNMQFDYIGKMESFADDAHFIISKLRNKYADVVINFGDFDTGTALDTAQGHVRFLYQALNKVKHLRYPKYNFFLRTWRDLQIRGHLSKETDMPLSQNQVTSISQEDFFKLIKEALEKPANKTDVKHQRIEAMVQAYSAVPEEIMERLTKYVEQDCFLFGYDVRPAILFDRNKATHYDFNYFDGI